MDQGAPGFEVTHSALPEPSPDAIYNWDEPAAPEHHHTQHHHHHQQQQQQQQEAGEEGEEARPPSRGVTFTREEYHVVQVTTTTENGGGGGGGGIGNGFVLPKAFSNPSVTLDASIHSVVESVAESVVKADGWAKTYCEKWRGSAKAPIVLKTPTMRHHALSLFQAAVAITFLAYMDILIMEKDMVLMVGSFGASAVLVYSAIDSPLAQPRNVILGHFFSALVGVTMQKLLAPWQPPVAAGLAVGTAIVVMERTHSIHPPGGATALFAVIGSKRIHDLGYMFCIFPALIGAMVMVFIACLFNNMEDDRSYPRIWYFPELECLAGMWRKLWSRCRIPSPR